MKLEDFLHFILFFVFLLFRNVIVLLLDRRIFLPEHCLGQTLLITFLSLVFLHEKYAFMLVLHMLEALTHMLFLLVDIFHRRFLPLISLYLQDNAKYYPLCLA